MKKILVMLGCLFVTPALADVSIVVDKQKQEMILKTGDITHNFKVSTGRKGFSTPVGDYKPYVLETMHYSKKYNNAPMPYSVFFHGGYAIHATGETWKLGRPASHGCVRLSKEDAKTVFEIVRKDKANTQIVIR